MAAKYYTILTNTGKAKLANAAALGRQVKLTHLAVGDSGGSEYDPTEEQTSLIQERYRTPISHIGTDAQNPNWVVSEGMIPVDVGGWFVREVGVFDEDGDLFAIGKYPETYKPTLAEGTGRDLYIRFIMVVSNVDTIDLKIDPTVAIATKDWTAEQITLNVDASKAQMQEEMKHLGDVVLNRINSRRGGNAWGAKVINILGDSISHGANVPDVPNDSWVGITRKLLNLEFGATNHGFVPIVDKMGSGENIYQEIHKVTRNGNWGGISGPDASHLMSGYAFASGNAGDTLEIEVPTIAERFAIWYDRKVGGGSFRVYVNGTDVGTLTTSSPDEAGEGGFYWHNGSALKLKDDGTGKCTIRLEVVGNGVVTIMGLSYLDDASEFQVNNFSQSGRKARDLSDDVIKKAVVGAQAVVFALGHNDQYLTGSEKNQTLANLDLLAEKCKQYETKLYILDFCWHKDYSNYVRQKLKEISKDVPRCTYVNFAEYFKIDGSTVSTATTINKLEFLSDGSHPTEMGHQIIAETLAKSMGLSFNSKKAANMFYQVWKPIDNWLDPLFKNKFDSSRYVTACRRNGNALHVRIYTKYTDDPSVEIPSGSYDLFRLPDEYFVPYSNVELIADSAGANLDSNKLCYLTVSSGYGSKVAINMAPNNKMNNIIKQFSIPLNCDHEFDMY
ncbi:TPA: phage tail protein [Vibrio parahaemolyticus]